MFCLKLTFGEPALLAADATINITHIAQVLSNVMTTTTWGFPKESAILFLSHDYGTALNMIQNKVEPFWLC